MRELGRHTFTAEDIKRFARGFDPQPFHMDEEAAKRSHFGALCASGWHTTAACMRLIVDYHKRLAAEMIARGERPAKIGPSPGFKNLKWLKPIYAGDTVAFASEVIEMRPSAVAPAMGRRAHAHDRHQPEGRARVRDRKRRLHRAARGLSAAAASTRQNERRALGVASGAHALFDGYSDLLYVLLPIWQAEFGLGYAAIGMLRGLFSGAMASFQIPASFLADRVGARLMLAASVAIGGAGYCLAGASVGFVSLVIALLIGGLRRERAASGRLRPRGARL